MKLTGHTWAYLVFGASDSGCYVNPGDYLLITSVADIWGNQSSEVDALTLTEALGP